jgi:hypothetical protein
MAGGTLHNRSSARAQAESSAFSVRVEGDSAKTRPTLTRRPIVAA